MLLAKSIVHNESLVLDPATLRRLWDSHSDRLLLIARSVGSDAAEDAVQDAYVALATQQQVPRDPLAWLVKVTRNQILQSHRGSRRRVAREQSVVIDNWFGSSESMIDDKLDGEAVTSALQRMPSPTREIIVMHLWGEITFESIADVVGVSRASTHRSYKNGIQELREQFTETANRPTVFASESNENSK